MFLELPTELISEILSFLTLKDLAKCCRVCKYLRSIAIAQNLWNGVFVKLFPSSSSASPNGRVCNCYAICGSRLYIHGGDRGDPFAGIIQNIQKDVWCFDFDSRTWTCLLENTQVGLTEHTAVVGNDEKSMIIFGGNRGSSFSNSIYQYSFIDNSFQEIVPNNQRPSPRSAHSAVIFNHKMFIFGGWDSTHSFNDFWSFDCISKEWNKLDQSGEIPSIRRTHKATIKNGFMYVFGGFADNEDPSSFDDIYRVDLNGLSSSSSSSLLKWEKLKVNGNKPSGRARSTLIADPKQPLLYLIGGWNRKDHFNDLYTFNTDFLKWRLVSNCNLDVISGGIAQHSCIIYENQLVVFGGYHSLTDSCSNDVLMMRFKQPSQEIIPTPKKASKASTLIDFFHSLTFHQTKQNE